MSAGLPQQIDVRRFAESGRHLESDILLQDCPRLNQAVKAGEGPISVVLDFERQTGNRPVIYGNILARVVLDCQRCLEPVSIDLQCEVSLGIVKDEAQAELLPDELDPLIAGDEVNLIELIEDELLLALPIVPVHEQCEPPATGEGHDTELPRRENPFAVLASLKKDTRPSGDEDEFE